MNQTQLNFCTHAIEDLSKVIRERTPTLPRYHPSERDTLATLMVYFQYVCTLLDRSVKFTLPDNGRLLNITDDDPIITDKELSLLKLPYPITALEYTAGKLNARLKEGNEVSEKRISLAIDFGKLSDHDKQIFIDLMPSIDPVANSEMIAVFSVYHSDNLGWSPSTGCVFISKDIPFRQRTGPDGKAFTAVASIPAPLRVRVPGNETRQQILENLSEDTADECIVLAEFCAIMNCANVGTMVMSPSAKLNKKRVQSGKLPMFEYHVLMLNPGSGSGKSGQSSGGGSHASPRMHLRRGHIRRLSETRVTWVNAAVIGNKKEGVIEKSYQVKG